MDWFMFVLIGILCGVLSVMYVGVNEAIIRFRRTYAAKYKILGYDDGTLSCSLPIYC
jgi:hypothetical protein